MVRFSPARNLKLIILICFNQIFETKENENQATVECGFTLKCVHDMIRTYSRIFETKENKNLTFIN